MNPLILFVNIVAWAWLAYSTTALLFLMGYRAYLTRRGVNPGLVSLHWWTVPMLVVAAAWLSVFSGIGG